MPLKTSGEISFSEIAGEFFKSPPYRLSEFYRGSLLVPDTELNIGVPTSGTLAFSDFYGTAFAIPPTIPAGAIVFYTGASAPSGWQEYTAAYGRYVKGTINTSQIGTTSRVAIPNGIPQSGNTGTAGAHNGSLFDAGDMGSTTGFSGGYPLNSTTPGNHSHQVLGISRTDAENLAPEPPHAVFKMIKTLADTQVLPAGSIIMSQNRPSPAWNSETRVSGSNNIYVKASGMGPGEIDRLTGLPSVMSSTTSSNGSHSHRVNDNNRFYNAGTNTTVNLDQNDGNHTHSNANVTVSVLRIKSIAINLWRSVQNTIGANNTIFMYDGNLDNLPEDWYVCNGLNGTVDLSDRFIQIGGSGGVQHGVKEENSQLQFQWASILSSPNPSAHNHRQTNTATYRTFRQSLNHQLYTWGHNHTAPTTSTQTGNVYSPPAISLGFIQYIKDNVNLSSITISQNATTVNEGATVTITVSHTYYPVGTVIYWDTEAVAGTLETNEFSDNSLTGSFTITALNSSNNVLRTLTNDAKDEGPEIFKIRFYLDAARTQLIGASQNITINDTSLPQYLIRVLDTNGVDTVTVNEGDTVIFELLTTVSTLTAGTTVYWSTLSSMMTGADFTDNAVQNGVNLEAFGAYRRALVSRTIKADAETEGYQEFRLQFRTSGTSGTVRATSNFVVVNDTSLTPTYRNISFSGSNTSESAAFTYEFASTNVPPQGETLYWVITVYVQTGAEQTILDTTDFIDGTSGTVLAPGNGSNFSVNVNARLDERTEPNEFFKLDLRRGSIAGEVVSSTVGVMTVPSTSNATYTLTSSTTAINWGDNISFTLTRTAGTHGTNTVFYIVTTNWDTNDFNTAEVIRLTPGAGTQTTFSINTKSATVKAGKNFRVEVYNDDPSGTGIIPDGIKIIQSADITIRSAGFTSLTPAASSVNEGTALAFTLSTTGIGNNTTVYWNIDYNSSSAAADFSVTQGSVSIQNNSATISVTPVADATTEGNQTFRLRVYTDSARTNLAITSSAVTINDTSRSPTVTSLTRSPTSVNEGASVTFTATGENHTSTTTYYYRLVAVSGTFNVSDITSGSLDGTISVSSATQSGTASITLTNDATTEGTESFRMDLYRDSGRTDLVISSASVSVSDTSLSPTYVFGTIPNAINEGASGTFNVNTTNVSNNTTLYWTISHNTSSSADFSATDGSFNITSNRGSFSISLLADQLTEGNETFAVAIRTGSTSGSIVAISNQVTIGDTSLTRFYAFGTIPTVINEGTSGTFNVTTTNVPNSTVLYWSIRNVTTTNADFSATGGSFTINSNVGNFSVSPTADRSTEGPQTFQAEIRTNSTTGSLQAVSASVTVGDTSLNPPGQFERTTAGTSLWVCPSGVTSVSVLCIGAGGGGKYNGGGGGSGGNLCWKNNYPVLSGTTYYLRAGTGGLGSASGTAAAGNGSVSYFGTSSTSTNNNLFAGGGGGGSSTGGGQSPTAAPPSGAGVTTFRGGAGGNGSGSRGPGGGGAGGYTGVGGTGGGTQGNATAGSSGGGGGGYSGNNYGGRGGGTRLYGSGSNGAAGSNVASGIGGAGGAGGAGTTAGYGGGGPGDNGTATASTLDGVNGAVRIMWPGDQRSYPSTRTANES